MILSDGPANLVATEVSNVNGIRSGFWSCTAGRFLYSYPDCDETIFIIEGTIELRDCADPLRALHYLNEGDSWHFKRGSAYEWIVHTHVKKFWVINDRVPLLRRIRRIAKFLKTSCKHVLIPGESHCLRCNERIGT